MSNLPTIRMGDKDVTITQMLASRVTAIDEVLPEASGMTGEQLSRIAQNEVFKNPDLAECNPMTIMNSVYDAARLGLMIGREAHLVPYRKVCKMIPDYRGFLTLVYRSGLVSIIDAKIVFPEDEFEVREGTDMSIHHIPDYTIDREQGENLLYVYAVAELHGSRKPIFHVMNKAAIDKIRDSSAMKNGIPWSKWYDRMALKSGIKYLSDKRLPATKIRGLADLIELDNRAETGSVRGTVSWEDDAAVRASLSANTKEKQDALKARLAENGEKEEPPLEEPEVLSSVEDADRQAREDDAKLVEKDKKGGKKK